MDQGTYLADRGVGLGCRKRPELRVARIGDRRVILARGQDEGRVAKVEGSVEPQVERAGNAALYLVRRLRFEGVDPRARFGGPVLHVEAASGGGHAPPPVPRRQNTGEAANATGREPVVAGV